ncbi:hypothetical protein M1L60_33690 [Actinoplanes sp. TRM 88003]|uniref:Uncharacterized protein n=1 Tax=Paractinoplanes aksuensis TaxID=2939490 RepID=A0ABT1DXG5_9ACTN|nr:hypothetical protein [Actinoplanes aksuensis]MCO8275549.1 hypothetical protein [Actinoplanes aksuensis]
MTDTFPALPARCHDLLLRLAGAVPDDVLTAARTHLAHHRFAEAAQAVRDAVAGGAAPISAADRELLEDLSSGDVPAAGPDAPSEDADLTTAVLEFSPELPDAEGTTAVMLDLSGQPDQLDEIDGVVVSAVGQIPGSTALWRAWRWGAPGQPSSEPVRVYLLLTDDAAGRPDACDRAQSALATAGVADPQVEVFHDGTALPPYQRQALGRSALLWTTGGSAPVNIARVFDSYHDVTGGSFAADRPTLAGAELEQVALYLESGSVLLATGTLDPDPFDEGLGPIVPVTVRTDGQWVWNDAVVYFLRTYAISPDAELLEHIRTRRYRIAEPGLVAEHRALAALFRP